MSSPEVRGTAFAIFTLTDDIGKGAGPGSCMKNFLDDRINITVNCYSFGGSVAEGMRRESTVTIH